MMPRSATSSGRLPPSGGGRSPRERGFALVVVIMVVLLVSFLASQLALQVRAELRIAANEKARAIGHFLAGAGVNMSLFWLLGDKPLLEEDGEPAQFLKGYLYEDRLPAGRFRYRAMSEAGKIDLNAAPRRLLELFLEHQGLDAEQSAVVLDSLLDWRDADDLHRLNGAETETYQQLDDPYVPRNGNLQDPAEFFLIHGAQTLAGRFSPEEVFTVHNGQNKIDFNSLTAEMLDFLTGGDPARMAAYREAQEQYGLLNQAMAMEILGEERYSLLGPFLVYGSSRPNQNAYYFIEAIGEPDYGQPPEVEEESGTPPEVAEEGGQSLENGEEGGKPRRGVRARVLVRIAGPAVEYLSWTEDYL